MQLPDNYLEPGKGRVNPMAPYESHSWMWKSWLCRTPAAKQVQQRMLTVRSVLKGKQHSYHVVYRDAKKMVMACDQPAEDGQLDMYNMVLFVQCCTGMRMNEVFRPWIEMMPASNLDMEFMPENWMVQRGTSKQSDARLTKYSGQKDSFQGLLKREVKKPIAFGYTYAYVKERLDMVRKLAAQRWKGKYPETAYENATPKQLGQMFNAIVNTRIRKVFAPMWAFARSHNMPFGSHVCRALYANIAWEEWHRSLPHTSKPGFMADVLLHDPGNLTTTTRYATVNVSMELPATLDVDAKASMESLKGFVAIANDNMQELMKQVALLKEKGLPKSKKLRGQKAVDVMMQNVAGEAVVLQRVQHVRASPKMSEQDKLEGRMRTVQQGLELLQAHRINPTVANFSKIGVSSAFVFEFRQVHQGRIHQEIIDDAMTDRLAMARREWSDMLSRLPVPKGEGENVMAAFLARFSFDDFGPAPVREDLWDAIVMDVVTAAKILYEADKVLVDVQEWVSEEYKDPTGKALSRGIRTRSCSCARRGAHTPCRWLCGLAGLCSPCRWICQTCLTR